MEENMKLTLIIIVTIFSIVFSLPIFPYVIFEGLLRKDIKREPERDEINSYFNNKLLDFMIVIFFCLAYVVIPILIAIEIFQIGEKWCLMLIAYALFWQIMYAFIFMKKSILPVSIPILAIFFIVCIGLPLIN